MKINDGQNGLDNQLQNFSLTLLPRTIKYRLASVEQFDLLSCKYKPINESIEMIKLLNSALESKLEKPNLPKLNVDILEQYWAMKKPNTLGKIIDRPFYLGLTSFSWFQKYWKYKFY